MRGARRRGIVLVVAAVVALCAAQASAADRAFLGRWIIAGSQRAPWAGADAHPVPSDQKALIGKTVAFKPDRIVAPPPLTCRKPHYAIKAYDLDMLFQGGLTDPARQAAALDFEGSRVPTLETGCEGALDFHFAGPDKAMFALNNWIYVLTRAGKETRPETLPRIPAGSAGAPPR